MRDGHLVTPHDRGCFCHNKECPLAQIEGFPDDFIGPIECDFGFGPRNVTRVLGVARRNERLTFWLCDSCHNAVEIAMGRADPTEMPIKSMVSTEAGLIMPN